MSAVRVLGLCGFLAGILGAGGGFFDIPQLIGAANLVMLAGNIYAMAKR